MLDILDMLARRAAAAKVAISLCGEAASRPLEALVLAALGITTLSMPAASIMPVKALLAEVDLGRFRRVLATMRETADGEPSLRDSIETWARESGLPV